MGPEDRAPIDEGFEDKETEHEIDDRVSSEYVKDPAEDETVEPPKAKGNEQ